MLKKLALLSATVATTFAMHVAEININDKDLELGAKLDMGQFNESVEPDTVFIGATFLKADGNYSSPKTNSLDPFFDVSLLMIQNIRESPFRLGLGVKANYTNKFVSVPLGVTGEFLIESRKLVPMKLVGEVYYAPKVLSFYDGDNFFSYKLSFDIEIIKNGNITLGYRRLETNYVNNVDFVYNKSAFAGFKLKF